jgi:hypothetical protein
MRPIPQHLPPAIRWAIAAGESRAARDLAMKHARAHADIRAAFVTCARISQRLMFQALQMARTSI